MSVQQERGKQPKTFLTLIIASFVAVSVWYSLAIPRWQNSDEPFHYFYVKHLMKDHRLPTRDETYEAAHPPVYYLMGAAWAYPFKDRDAVFHDHWIRLMSVILGAVTVFFLFRIGNDFLGSPRVGIIMALLAVVNPMFVATSAVMSNDIGVIMMCTITFYMFLQTTKNGGSARAAAICGFFAGFSCLFKITANFLPVLFFFFYVFHPKNRGRGAAALIKELIVFGVVFAATCGWWFIMSYLKIGDKTFFNALPNASPNPLYVPENLIWFIKTIMMTFWVPNDYLRGHPENLPFFAKAIYTCISAVLVLLAGIQAVKYFRSKGSETKHIAGIFMVSLALFLAQQAAINMQMATAQARYMFTMYWAAAGFAALFLGELPERYSSLVPPALFIMGIASHIAWASLLLPGTGPPFNIR